MDDPVGVLDDALEAMLGEHDGDAEVVDEPGDRGEHLLGRGRVERRGGFVEHEHPRVRGQHRTDRDPLLLAARELGNARWRRSARPSRSSVSSTRLRMTGGGTAELLHPVRELLLDRVGDEPGERVLPDDADDVGQLARRVRPACRARRPSRGRRSVPPVKCGTSPLIAPSSVDLPDAGRADDEAQLALVDAHGHVAQHRRDRRRHR